MQTTRDTVDWQTLTDADAVATYATELILQAASVAIQERGVFRLVLAGGRTPGKVYQQLAASQADWNNWHVYFGDERCLPVDDAERNSRMAADAWLARGQVPADHIHAIPAELGAATAAHQYAESVRRALPFDMVILGMGEDGHTASLFPGHAFPPGELVHAVHYAPKPPPERVSLSAESLSDSRHVLVLVTGSGKRDAVSQWQQGADLPIARISARQRLTVLLDAAAADHTPAP
ncbi:MAG: 6-phosphogluconolactonase [Gammaproteobacteria bacterium]